MMTALAFVLILAKTSILTYLNLVGVVIGIVSFVAAALGYVRINLVRTTAELYRQDNDALRARNQTLEADKKMLETENAEYKGKVTESDKQITMLKDLVQGKAAVDALTGLVHREFVGQSAINAQVVSLLDSLATPEARAAAERARADELRRFDMFPNLNGPEKQ